MARSRAGTGRDALATVAAAETLFGPGRPFDRFPGGVLLAGNQGLILAANEAAGPIAVTLQQGGSEELCAAIEVALGGAAVQIAPLILGPGEAEQVSGLAFDVTIVPWRDGAAALLLARDVTLERNLRKALFESRQRYKDLIEASCDFAWETDAEGRFTFLSAQGALGHSVADLIGAAAPELLIDHGNAEETVFTTRVPVFDLDLWVRRADGEAACLVATALPLTGPHGAWCGARGLCRNMTAARSHEAALAGDRHRERLRAYVLGIVRDKIDPAQMLSAAARALVPALPATGVCLYRRNRKGALTRSARAGDLPAKGSIDALVQRVDRNNEEIEALVADGVLFAKAILWQEDCNGVLVLWRQEELGPWRKEDRFLLGEIAGQIGLANRQLARQRDLEELSTSDPLTGLLNRRGFMKALERRLGRRAADKSEAALFFIDLDNFKLVNDRRGHREGDRALRALARILRRETRQRDLAGRLGGDEFVLYLENIGRPAAEAKARMILRAGRKLDAYSSDPKHPLGLSIGIAICDPHRGEAPADLLNRADGAMYEVKRRGKGKFVFAPPPGGAPSRQAAS